MSKSYLKVVCACYFGLGGVAGRIKRRLNGILYLAKV